MYILLMQTERFKCNFLNHQEILPADDGTQVLQTQKCMAEGNRGAKLSILEPQCLNLCFIANFRKMLYAREPYHLIGRVEEGLLFEHET
jgi:hypothetical protein